MNKLIKTDNALSIPSFDLGGVLPDINDLVAIPIDLTVDYWTPEAAGESKRLFFKGVVEETRKNEDTGVPYEADVVYFIEQLADGSHKQIINQSVRMVSAVKALEPGTALQITYTGKKKTQSGHNIDTWHISPLVRNVPQIDDDGEFD